MKNACVYFGFVILALSTASGLGFAIENSEGLTKTNFEKAGAFFEQRDYDSAIEYCQKALQTEGRPVFQARIYNLIGLSYFKQAVSPASAIGSFEQAVRFDPKFAEAYFNMASVYADDQEQSGKAIEFFKKAIEVDPTYYKAYFGLGWFILTKEQDAEQSIQYFQTTVEHYPEFAEAQYGLGLAYIKAGKSHMTLGAVSKLRDLKRDDLAASLEKIISDSAPAPPPAETAPAPQTNVAAEETPEEPRVERKAGGSPFGVLMQRKRNAQKQENAG